MDGRAPRARTLLRLLPLAVALAVVLAGVATLFRPSLERHFARTHRSWVVNDDARQQICHFHRYAAPDLLRDDPITDYYLALFPVGYHALFAGVAKLGSPLAWSKDLPYLLLAVTVLALAAAAFRLGGVAAAGLTAALALSSTDLVRSLGGALPHAFGMPLVALGLALLAWGRLRALAVLTPLAVAFYPVTAVALGLALALALGLLPRADRGAAATWSARRRLATLAASGLATVVLVLPPAWGSHQWGPLIGPARLEAYPEAAPGGRYGGMHTRPFPGFVASLPGAVDKAFWSRGGSFVPTARRWLDGGTRERPAPRRAALYAALPWLVLLGGLGLAARSAAARRVALFPLAVLAAHAAAQALDPRLYLPPRHVELALPALLLAVAPAAAGGLLAWVPGRRTRSVAQLAATLVLGGALFAAVGGRVHGSVGVSQDESRYAPLYEAIRETPRDALFAGWPRGAIEATTLFTRRRAFLTHETHQAFHARYVELLRGRTHALMRAWFATDLAPLRALRDDFGVTHLLVDLDDFEGRPPVHFLPFRPEVARRSREAGRDAVLPRWAERHAIARAGRVVLVPLDAL